VKKQRNNSRAYEVKTDVASHIESSIVYSLVFSMSYHFMAVAKEQQEQKSDIKRIE
jgi:hypothetical protein